MKCMLKQELALSTVSGVESHMNDWLASGAELEVDGSAVERVDAAGLQALVSLFTRAKADNQGIVLVNPSSVLREAIHVLQLGKLLNVTVH